MIIAVTVNSYDYVISSKDQRNLLEIRTGISLS